MGIKITFGDEEGVSKDGEPERSIHLNVRRDLAGNYMIFDHGDIDIVVKTSERKILTFGKEEALNIDVIYDAQDRLFNYLTRKGVIDPESIEGGNIFGSMEAEYLDAKEESINSTHVVLFTIGKFIEKEKPHYMFRKEHEQDMIDWWAFPDDERSTELGDVPQAIKKGSIEPHMTAGTANSMYTVYERKISDRDVSILFERTRI